MDQVTNLSSMRRTKSESSSIRLLAAAAANWELGAGCALCAYCALLLLLPLAAAALAVARAE